MSDSSFTIGDFAESLIANELGKVQEDPSYIAEAVSSESPDAGVPDLRKVRVPRDFMSEVLGESVEPEVLEEPQPEVADKPQTLNEETLVLMEQLHSLVKNLDSVLTELTSTGLLGVGPGNQTKYATSFIKNLKGGGYKKARRSRYRR